MSIESEESIIWAKAAIAAHSKTSHIEGNSANQVMHLLVSLEEFCSASNIDLDQQLAEARNYLAKTRQQTAK